MQGVPYGIPELMFSCRNRKNSNTYFKSRIMDLSSLNKYIAIKNEFCCKKRPIERVRTYKGAMQSDLELSAYHQFRYEIRTTKYKCTLNGRRQAKMCLRACAKCTDSDSSHACAESLSIDAFYNVQWFWCWSGPSLYAYARRHVFA